MQRTASYLIVISKDGAGYTAACPAFPDLQAHGHGARRAYSDLKIAIQGRLLAAFARGETPTTVPPPQTKILRLDLWYLREQEELR